MDPDDSGNKLKQQIQALRSSNRSAILDTLKDLRDDGDVSVLPDLFNLMLVQEDREILGEISSLLNDLKDQEAAAILVEAVANPEYQDIRTSLVAACWQNGLSYSKHISTFVEVALTGDYSTAIEAFTVIEAAATDLEKEERTRLVLSLKSQIPRLEELKKPLLVELVKLMEST